MGPGRVRDAKRPNEYQKETPSGCASESQSECAHAQDNDVHPDVPRIPKCEVRVRRPAVRRTFPSFLPPTELSSDGGELA
jgi:hypothetical protein